MVSSFFVEFRRAYFLVLKDEHGLKLLLVYSLLVAWHNYISGSLTNLNSYMFIAMFFGQLFQASVFCIMAKALEKAFVEDVRFVYLKDKIEKMHLTRFFAS